MHLLVTAKGHPVEFSLSQGSLHDLEGLKRLPLDLPAGATLYGDKAYKDQNEEWLLQHAAGLRFLPLTRSNAKKPLPPCLVYLAHIGRQQVVKVQGARKGFVLLPKRWVVERSFAWVTRFRRLAKDYERLAETVKSLHIVAFVTLMLTNCFK